MRHSLGYWAQTAFAQRNSRKWFSSHIGTFFNSALSGMGLSATVPIILAVPSQLSKWDAQSNWGGLLSGRSASWWPRDRAYPHLFPWNTDCLEGKSEEGSLHSSWLKHRWCRMPGELGVPGKLSISPNWKWIQLGQSHPKAAWKEMGTQKCWQRRGGKVGRGLVFWALDQYTFSTGILLLTIPINWKTWT